MQEPHGSPDDFDETLRAEVGYPTTQLQRALETAARADDSATRERAGAKALLWEQVIAGITSGTLAVGSRTPVADTPSWVTLDVAHGGFATGNYKAGGELEAWEEGVLADLPTDFGIDLGPRHRLNTWYLSDEGLTQLTQLLADRTYTVDIPEAGALLVVAWLTSNRFESAALDLVAELYPFIDQLRFYPVPSDQTPIGGTVVSRQTAGEVAEAVRAVETSDKVIAMPPHFRYGTRCSIGWLNCGSKPLTRAGRAGNGPKDGTLDGARG